MHCYISASLQVLLGSTVKSFLPDILENSRQTNIYIHSVAKRLTESSLPLNFEFKDRSSKDSCEPIMGQVLRDVLHKDYRKNEFEDARLFVENLLETLFEDELYDDPFKYSVADLEQCRECYDIRGNITKERILNVFVFDNDRP